MQWRTSTEDLKRWAERSRDLREAEDHSEGFRLLMARIRQEELDAAEELLRLPRWNWYRVLKALMRRDAARTFRVYVEEASRLGLEAEKQLRGRDPQAYKDLQRLTFVHSSTP